MTLCLPINKLWSKEMLVNDISQALTVPHENIVTIMFDTGYNKTYNLAETPVDKIIDDIYQYIIEQQAILHEEIHDEDSDKDLDEYLDAMYHDYVMQNADLFEADDAILHHWL